LGGEAHVQIRASFQSVKNFWVGQNKMSVLPFFARPRTLPGGKRPTTGKSHPDFMAGGMGWNFGRGMEPVGGKPEPGDPGPQM